MFRFLFGFLRLKFVLFAVALYFAWSTLGTVWTLLIAWALAAYALYHWGPKGEGKENGAMMGFATRGNPIMSVVVPLLLPMAWPWFVIAHMVDEGIGPKQ